MLTRPPPLSNIRGFWLACTGVTLMLILTELYGPDGYHGKPVLSAVVQDWGDINFNIDLAVWARWLPWEACSVSCGSGTRQRSRFCLPGKECNGPTTESLTCQMNDCAGKVEYIIILIITSQGIKAHFFHLY